MTGRRPAYFRASKLEDFGDIMTPQDVALYLKVTDNCVTTHIRKGDLKGFKVGNNWRIKKIDLIEFIKANENKGNL